VFWEEKNKAIMEVFHRRPQAHRNTLYGIRGVDIRVRVGDDIVIDGGHGSTFK
jgi:hypothetical protein